jgi:hypothetical protein
MAPKKTTGNAFDLVKIQAKLEQSPEKRVWRGLEELAGPPTSRVLTSSQRRTHYHHHGRSVCMTALPCRRAVLVL